jgi:imidazole glycerol-phosphate synthase subunit HisH
MDVVIVDYGSGNLRSAQRALEHVGAQVEVTDDIQRATRADAVVVPGVGAFTACMTGIRERGVDAMLRERVARSAPVLGICVGLQVLFDRGVEHGITTPGIGLLPGVVDQLEAPVLPHMGWDTVEIGQESRLFAGLAGQRFSYVHSYAVRDWHAITGVVTTCTYGEPFVAAVEQGTLMATQFHPEKSGDAGLHLLENWLQTLQ